MIGCRPGKDIDGILERPSARLPRKSPSYSQYRLRLFSNNIHHSCKFVISSTGPTSTKSFSSGLEKTEHSSIPPFTSLFIEHPENPISLDPIFQERRRWICALAIDTFQD